ncbi:hypothetical protein [Roseateles noduli]|uniref:hypothetical protein n=1 Tax=Roseateles noduli TaxID=2052484 RepID=UPI003D649A0F
MNFELPRSSFVPFPVTRIAAPRLLWTNPSIVQEWVQPTTFWCVPHPGDDPSAFGAEQRPMFADRYGGKGVGANGGSGRSAVDASLQVKGVGRTPLVGQSSDPEYSHGGMTLSEAVREAIWSEIYAGTTPFGSVKSLAIVATGTKTYLESDRRSKSATRVLLLRERAIRPAHFMRAPNFSPEPEPGLHQARADVVRTRDSVRALVECVDKLRLESCTATTLMDVLLDAVLRFAAQIAATRAKRIPHGSLNCSNIAMDGRLIDFGTATSLSDFGPAMTSVGKFPFWREDLALLPSIRNLVFSFGRYAGGKMGREVVHGEQHLVETFSRALEDRTAVEMVKLTGLTERQASAIPLSCRAQFAAVAEGITALRGGAPFLLEEMPTSMGGAAHLPTVLALLACSSSHQAAAGSLAALGLSPGQTSSLVDSYARLRPADPSAQGSSAFHPWDQAEPVSRSWRALNALRLSLPHRRLHRLQLARDITADLQQGGTDWQRFIDDRATAGVRSLADTQSVDAQVLADAIASIRQAGSEGGAASTGPAAWRATVQVAREWLEKGRLPAGFPS